MIRNMTTGGMGTRGRKTSARHPARGTARSTASGECRFSPCSDQKDHRPRHDHARRGTPARFRRTVIPRGQHRQRDRKVMLQHRDEVRHERGRFERRGQSRLHFLPHFLMIPPIAESFAFFVAGLRRGFVVAGGVMRPVTMIRRRPLDRPGAIAPITPRYSEGLRAEQRRAAKHGKQPKVWQGAVHARVISLEIHGSARPFAYPPHRARLAPRSAARPGFLAARRSGRAVSAWRAEAAEERFPRPSAMAQTGR